MKPSLCREIAVRASSAKFPFDFKPSLDFLSSPKRQYTTEAVAQPLPDGTPSTEDQPEVSPTLSVVNATTKKSFRWLSVTYDGAAPPLAATQTANPVTRESKKTSSYLSDPENSGRRTRGVNFDTLGSWNNRLQLKIDIDESIKRGTIVPMIALSSVGKNSLIGRRPTNEDRIISVEIKPNILLFGILDGHGGPGAVDHVHEQLPKTILHWLDRGETKLEEVLRKSYIEVNNSFTKLHQQNSNGDEQSVSSGTTATVCLIRDGVELTIAHVGDSRAILCRNNASVRLTVDHLPSEQSEAARIIKCKGHLTWSSLGRSRVNGRLEMTRSIGDVELKTYGVIADPDITTVKIKNGSDSFLALTTDGIHNRLNSSEIVQLIASCATPHEAAEFLTDQALLFGSEDNCSIVVIPFGAWGKFAEAARQVHFSRNRNPGLGWYS